MGPQTHVSDAPAIQTWEAADGVLARIRSLDADAARLEGEKEGKLAELKRQYDGPIKDLKTQSACLAKDLREFSELHRADMGKGKSMKLSSGVVGFREGNLAVEPISKSWTWKKVLACMLPEELVLKAVAYVAKLGCWGKYVRVDFEINKQAILEDKRLKPEKLREIGLRIDSVERWYYDVGQQPAQAQPSAA